MSEFLWRVIARRVRYVKICVERHDGLILHRRIGDHKINDQLCDHKINDQFMDASLYRYFWSVIVSLICLLIRLSRLLRSKECELVIALTHMRAPNDERLAREAEDIDLILGGHDHEYYGVKRIGKWTAVRLKPLVLRLNACRWVINASRDFSCVLPGKTIVCKSGCDFREFTALTIYPGVKSSARMSTDIVDYDALPFPTLIPGDRAGGAYLMPK